MKYIRYHINIQFPDWIKGACEVLYHNLSITIRLRWKKVVTDKKPLNKMDDWGSEKHKKIEVDGIQCVWFPLLDHGVPKIFHETKLSMVNHSISSFYSSVEVASNSTMLKTCLWPSFPCCHRLNFCHIPLSFVSGVCSPTRSFLVSVLWWWS